MGKVHLYASRFPDSQEIANTNRITFASSIAHLKFQNCLWFLLLLTATIAMYVNAPVVRAQGKIIAIEKNLRPLKTLAEADIKLVRGATRRFDPIGIVPIDVEIGDRLIGGSKDVAMKISCNKSSELVLSGRFVITFLRSKKDGGCSVFDDGKGDSTVNVKAGDTTSIQTGKYGEIRLGSKRTRYEVRSPARLDRPAEPPPDVFVFEGEVDVESPVFSGTVNEGKKLETEGDSRPKIKELDSKDFLRSAEILARIDVSQADNVKDLNAAYLKMVSLHREVLKQPSNPAKVMALKKGQQELGLADLVLTLKSGAKGTGSILFVNRCTKPINVRFAIENLPNAHFLTATERSIIPGGQIKTSVEFDSSSLQPGRYSGAVTASCVDCSKQKCLMERQQWTVILNVL